MHAAVRDTVGKLCFPTLFCIECLIKQLNCYACSSAEISSIIVTDSSTLTPRYFLSNDAYRLTEQLHAYLQGLKLQEVVFTRIANK